MQEQVLEILDVQEMLGKCQLCSQDELQLGQYYCLEQTLQICSDCSKKIKRKIQKAQGLGRCHVKQYRKKIELVYIPSRSFYKLQYKQCEICFKNKICSKICSKEHLFCFGCSKFYFLTQLNKKQIICPQDQCDQLIDHFIISLFLDGFELRKWIPLNRNMFCPKNGCQNILRLSPYQMAETQIIKIDNDMNQCSSCKSKICSYWWTDFKGTYRAHSNICNTDNYRNQLLKQCILEYGIFQCPKCKFYSRKTCPVSMGRIQQCQLCGTKFCLFCKSADLQLFLKSNEEEKGTFDCNCNCVNNFIKKKFLWLVLLAFLWFVYLPIHLFLRTGRNLAQHLEFKCIQLNVPYKRYFFYIFYPFKLIFKILKAFFVYANKLERFGLNKIDKMIGVAQGLDEELDYEFY